MAARWLSACCCLLLSWAVQAAPPPRPNILLPNILLIVLDDAGYSDMAGFGRNDAPTPHLKQLADEGVRFTRHYADSTCRPARLALLTGREAARVAQNPDFRGIPPGLTTLPEALRAAGYRTHHVGKWHLGDSVREAWPDRAGFDSWFGFLNQFQLKGPDAQGRFTKRPTYLDPWLQGNDQPLSQHRGHLEDLLAERVTRLIKDASKHSQPWLINYWLFAPHHPSTASAEFLRQYPDSPEGRYRALLAQADAEIGKAVQALRDSGQLDRTLIVVTSDNGGTNQMMNNNAPFAGVKGGFEEGSLRTPLIIRWPDQRHAGETRDSVVAIQDIYPTVLAAAGIAAPTGLEGLDLHPLLAGKPLAPRSLVHEIASLGLFNYSLLSEDGQWRATGSSLYWLATDTTGSTDVRADFPQRQQQLARQYADWRNGKTALALQREPAAAGGPTRLTGDDFRRAPGYGALSFAVGAQLPDRVVSPAYLATQVGVWSLTYQPDHRFALQIGTDTLLSDPVAMKTSACTPVVLSTLFTRSRLHEGRNSASLQLYVGDQQLGDWTLDNPAEMDADLTAPTWIGQHADGSGRWPGRLGVAQLYNTALLDDRRGPTAAHDGLRAVQTAACSGFPVAPPLDTSPQESHP